MEAVFVLLALGLVGLAMVGSLVGLFAWARTSRLEKRIDELAREVSSLRRSRGAAPAETGAPVEEPRPAAPVVEPPRPAAPIPPRRPSRGRAPRPRPFLPGPPRPRRPRPSTS